MLNISLNRQNTRELIHEKSLHILENTGVAFHYEPALELLKQHGARVEGHTAFIPPALVEKCLGTCPESFVLEGRDPAKSARFGNNDTFLVLPNLGPVFILETNGKKRRGTMEDYINITRLSHNSPVVDVVGSCPIDAEDADADSKFLEMIYQSCRYSDKPVMCCTGSPPITDQQIRLMELSFGRPGIMKDKIITGTSLSPLSPLAYAEDAAYCLMTYAEKKQMVIIAGAPMSGISAPVTISGTTVLINVEFLAGMVLAQCQNPGTPVVYATTASGGNLRNGTYVTSTPDTTLLNAFAAQMGQYYKVPARSVGTTTDAKITDMQAGYEAMQSLMVNAFAGIDAIYETLGTVEALMSVSYEKFMIDLELISRVKELFKGVVETPEQLNVEEIENIGIGGNYLTQPTTLKACRERWSPSVSDWWPVDKWAKDGARDVIQRAAEACKEALGQPEEIILENETAKEMKAFIEQCGHRPSHLK